VLLAKFFEKFKDNKQFILAFALRETRGKTHRVENWIFADCQASECASSTLKF